MTVDRKRLRELAMAATPGEWRWHTGCSWRRLAAYVNGRNERDGNVILPVTDRHDKHPDLVVSREDQEFIAAANPQTILALLDALDAAEQPAPDDALNAAINRAARDLPEGLVVAVHAERGSGWVTLESTAGERFPTPADHYDSLAAELNAAIDAAIQAQERTS
jgi:hypothetical protein